MARHIRSGMLTLYRTRRSLVLVLTIALLVRVVALICMRDGLSIDVDGYRALADNLMQYGVYGTGTNATAYRPPLYSLLLAIVALGKPSSALSIGLFHLVLGVVTVLVVYRIAHLWMLGASASLAAVFVAADPILLNQSTKIMSETLAACCAALCLLFLPREGTRISLRAVVLANAVIAVASLCRPHFLVWLFGIALLLVWLETSWSRRGLQFGAVACVAVLALLPWTIRNATSLGSPIITTTHGGYTLLLGNNPSFYQYLRDSPWGEVWDGADTLPSRDGIDELDFDRINYAMAWQTIRLQPAMMAYASLVRIGRLWGLVPHQLQADESALTRIARYGTGCWYLLLYSLAFLGLVKLQRNLGKTPWIWGVLLCLSWTAVHLLFWSNLRMRAPLVPFLALLAAAGVQMLAEYVSDRHPTIKQRFKHVSSIPTQTCSTSTAYL